MNYFITLFYLITLFVSLNINAAINNNASSSLSAKQKKAMGAELATVNQQSQGLEKLSGNASQIRKGILLPGEAAEGDEENDEFYDAEEDYLGKFSPILIFHS